MTDHEPRPADPRRRLTYHPRLVDELEFAGASPHLPPQWTREDGMEAVSDGSAEQGPDDAT